MRTYCILSPTEINGNINIVRIAGLRFEIRTLNLPNTNPTSVSAAVAVSVAVASS
jgi:hypothetical protein